MNSANKKAPGARGIPQPFNQQAGHASQHKPVVAQLKTLVPAHRVKTPMGPPAFSPLAAPKAAQPKMANSAVSRKPARAPSIYRPQPAPQAAQPKMANGYANRGTIQLMQCGECFQHNSHLKTCSKWGAPKVAKKNEQSLQDRNVNKYLAYQTPNKKTVEKDVEKVKKLKTTLAHGSGNNQSAQSGKTKKILKDLK